MGKRAIVIIALASMLTHTGCCTLLGLGVGVATDTRRPHGKIPPTEWANLPRGTDVDVVLVDGFRVGGDFVRVSRSRSDSAAVVVEDDRGSQSVPVSEIRKITYGHAHRGATIGLLVGFGIDVAIDLVLPMLVESGY